MCTLSLQIPGRVACPDTFLALVEKSAFFTEIRKKCCDHYNTSQEISGKITKLSQEPFIWKINLCRQLISAADVHC